MLLQKFIPYVDILDKIIERLMITFGIRMFISNGDAGADIINLKNFSW